MQTNLQIRASVVALQRVMEEGIENGAFEDLSEQAPVEHFFTPVNEQYGCAQYARQLFMPKGSVVVGKLHKLPHLTFLLKGRVIVVSENGGKQELAAPLTFVSPAGVKRAFHVLEDTILTTVHLSDRNNEQDLAAIEDEVISPSYSALGLEEPDQTGINKFLEAFFPTFDEEPT